MTWKAKAGIVAGVVLLFSALCFIIYHQHQQLAEQAALKQQIVDMKTLQDGIVRAQASYTTKDDLKQFAKDNNLNLAEIQKDLNNLHAEMKGINEVVASTPGYSGSNLSSTGTAPRPTTDNGSGTSQSGDPYGYLQNTQKLALNEPMSDGSKVPFGQVGFSAWRKAPWDLTIKPRQYKSFTVLSEDGTMYITNWLFQLMANNMYYLLPAANLKSSILWQASGLILI